MSAVTAVSVGAHISDPGRAAETLPRCQVHSVQRCVGEGCPRVRPALTLMPAGADMLCTAGHDDAHVSLLLLLLGSRSGLGKLRHACSIMCCAHQHTMIPNSRSESPGPVTVPNPEPCQLQTVTLNPAALPP